VTSARISGVREFWWTCFHWIVGGFLVYLFSYGPAVWIEPSIENKNIRSVLESVFVPAGYVLFETPLRPFGVWYVSRWVPIRRK